MKVFINMVWLICFNNSYGQIKITDLHPLIGKLKGPIKYITIHFTTVDKYNPLKTDTIHYQLNLTTDTAYLFKGTSKEAYSIHIYNKKGQLIKQQIFDLGKKQEYSYRVEKNKPLVVTIEKNKILDDIRVDTTKRYYDRRGNLIMKIETNNITKSRFKTIYKYDLQGNLTDEKDFVFNGDIKTTEEVSKHSKTIYKYDNYGNWLFKKVSYVSVPTGEPYQTITATRIISYKL